MKQILILVLLIALMPDFANAQAGKKPGNVLLGVFDGRSPCKEMAAQLKENVIPECTKIKWRLVLYKDSVTGAPDNYELYGLIYRNATPRIGKWKITKGMYNNPDATVYELEFSDRPTLLLMKADDNIFFWLTQDRKLMVGNGDFSYTLNRTHHTFDDILVWARTRVN